MEPKLPPSETESESKGKPDDPPLPTAKLKPKRKRRPPVVPWKKPKGELRWSHRHVGYVWE